MIEECENIRFAWSTLEDWATHSLRGMINCEQLLERLQRSIYSGQLIMTAMEQDLARAMPNAGTFKRHASLVWNEGVLQAHQSRIRGQVAALQLLLQVVSMPRNEDRLETLSIKAQVFADVDESVRSIRSIVPSRISSRISSQDSLADSERMSIKTNGSIKLRYKPFSFENDLFTSYVYKRNYRLPSFRRRSHSTLPHPTRHLEPAFAVFETKPLSLVAKGNELAIMEPAAEGNVIPLADHLERNLINRDDDGSARPGTVSDGTLLFSNHESAKTVPLPKLPYEHGIDIHEEHGVSCLRLTAMLDDDYYDEVFDLFRRTVDIAILFDERSLLDEALLDNVLWYILQKDSHFFNTALQRIALSGGLAWVEQFRGYFLSSSIHRDILLLDLVNWGRIESAGRSSQKALSFIDKLSGRPSILHLACCIRNYEVARYFLELGYRFRDEYNHPINYARVQGDRKLEAFLKRYMNVPATIITTSYRTLLDNKDISHILWSSESPSNLGSYEITVLPTAQAINLLLHHIDLSTMVDYLDKRMPFVYAALFPNTEHWTTHSIVYLRNLVEQDLDPVLMRKLRWLGKRASGLARSAAVGQLTKNLIAENAVIFNATMADVLDLAEKFLASETLDGVVILVTSSDLFCPDGCLHRQNPGVQAPKGTSNDSRYDVNQHDQISSNVSLKIPSAAQAHEKKCLRGLDIKLPMVDNDPKLSLRDRFPTFELKRDINLQPINPYKSNASQDLIRHLRRRRYTNALRSLKKGADLALVFYDPSVVLFSNALYLLILLWFRNPSLFRTALQRIAFTSGYRWVLDLQRLLTRRITMLSNMKKTGQIPRLCLSPRGEEIMPSNIDYLPNGAYDEAWQAIYTAGSFSDTMRDAVDKKHGYLRTFSLAYRANNIPVMHYMLTFCYIADKVSPQSMLSIAAANHSLSAVRYLLSKFHLSFVAINEALRTLITLRTSGKQHTTPEALISPAWKPSDKAFVDIINTLLSHGADASTYIRSAGQQYPLLHYVVYAIKDPDLRLDIVTLLLDQGAKITATGPIPWTTDERQVNSLTLAALLGLPDIVSIMVKRGARLTGTLAHFDSLQYLITNASDADVQQILNALRAFPFLSHHISHDDARHVALTEAFAAAIRTRGRENASYQKEHENGVSLRDTEGTCSSEVDSPHTEELS